MSRREQIIDLLRLLNEGLPEARSGARAESPAGFVNEARSRTCPDCLANGKVSKTCETCGGSGRVSPSRLALIAAPDSLPDDGADRDPYQKNEARPYGLTGEQHDRRVSIDTAIESARRDLKRFPGFRPQGLQDELEEANRNPYQWQRERDTLRRRFDLDALTAALDALRDRHPDWCALLHSVYVYGTSDPSTTVEVRVERALMFLDDRMPHPISSPGHEHARLRRQAKKAASG